MTLWFSIRILSVSSSWLTISSVFWKERWTRFWYSREPRGSCLSTFPGRFLGNVSPFWMSVTVRGKKGSLIALLLDGNGRVTSSLGIEAYAMREGYDRSIKDFIRGEGFFGFFSPVSRFRFITPCSLDIVSPPSLWKLYFGLIFFSWIRVFGTAIKSENYLLYSFFHLQFF